jgi:hypothetical protein
MAKRIITQPTKILDTSRGAYWRGERCEDIVVKRIADRAAEKAARRSKRASRSGADTEGAQRSPQATLRRLERALLRRKTEAGKSSVRDKINQLRRWMMINA